MGEYATNYSITLLKKRVTPVGHGCTQIDVPWKHILCGTHVFVGFCNMAIWVGASRDIIAALSSSRQARSLLTSNLDSF